MVPTLRTPRPILTSVSSSSSRMSGSSSTTRTWATLGDARLSADFIGGVEGAPCGARLFRRDPEMGTRPVVHIVERRAIGRAQLSRQVQAEPGSLAVGGEERLEQLTLDRFRDARAIVHDA